jgi:hypothetical protein
MSKYFFKKGILLMLISASLVSLAAIGEDWKWEE